MVSEKKLNFLPVVLILIFAGFLRLSTFFLAHTNFDEMAYLSLALKLDKYGFKNFEKNFDLHYIELKANEKFIAPVITEESIGNLLVMSQVDYEYKTPIHRPPLFSFILMLAHRLVSGNFPYLASRVNFIPFDLAFLQLYATAVPFIFSLLFILGTYFLGKMLFTEEIGLYAALFLCLTPMELFVSHKIWAETVLSFFTILTVIFYFLAVRKNSLFFSFLSGLCAAFSLLTKMTGGFIIIVIGLFHIWRFALEGKNFKNPKAMLGIIFEAKIAIFIFTFLLAAGPWLYIYNKNFGAGLPSGPVAVSTPWLQFIGHRPWYVYLVNIPFQFPVYFLLYAAMASLFFSRDKKEEKVFLSFWFLVTFLILAFKIWNKEDRYMLLCYPAIAILSAYMLSKFKSALNRKMNPLLAELIIVLFIIFTGAFALKLSFDPIISRIDLLNFPL